MSGVLACQEIADLIERGRIASDPAIIPAQIQPASLDLRLGNTAWRVRASFLAGKDAKVEQRLADFEMHKIDLSSGYVLEKGLRLCGAVNGAVEPAPRRASRHQRQKLDRPP